MAIGRFLNMQYRTGINKNNAPTKKEMEASLVDAFVPSNIRPIKEIIAKSPIINNINSAPEALNLLLLLTINSIFFLSKVILDLILTIIGTLITTIQNKMPAKGCFIEKTTVIPMSIKAKNITFQKLSLLSLLFIKSRIRVSRFLFNNYYNYTMYCAQLIGFCRYLVHFTRDIAVLELKKGIFTQIVQIVRFQFNSTTSYR